jgi:hypothetical protein
VKLKYLRRKLANFSTKSFKKKSLICAAGIWPRFEIYAGATLGAGGIGGTLFIVPPSPSHSCISMDFCFGMALRRAISIVCRCTARQANAAIPVAVSASRLVLMVVALNLRRK